MVGLGAAAFRSADGLAAVESVIRETAHAEESLLTEASLHLIDAGGKRFEIVRAEGLVDSPVAAECIDGDGDVGAFDVFEEQRLTAQAGGGGAIEFSMAMGRGRFADLVGNGRNLKDGRDPRLHA